jgi:chitin disaccharide deacetylase
MRQLIVNADDFGQTPGINRGIIQAFEKGIVTSASLMVRWPAAPQAAEYARRRMELSVGLHVDLGESIYRNGEWEQLYGVVPLGDARAIRDEIDRQCDRFRELMGRDPSHLDSHQHVHRLEPVQSIVLGRAESLGIPCRGYSTIQHCGGFYGQTQTGGLYPEGISVDALVALIKGLPEGLTELGCHPGFEAELQTMYTRERESEVMALCDARVRKVIEDEKIVLRSFGEEACKNSSRGLNNG